MKKILFLLPLFILALVGCSKTEVHADMYFLGSNLSPDVDDDFEILDTYSKYVNNEKSLKDYEESFFENHSLIILYLNDSTTGNKYGLREVSKTNSKLTIFIEYIEYGVGQAFSTTVYCVEVEAKGIKKVEVKRITNE